jgi:hypothetical protein
LFPDAPKATVAVLERLGHEVVFPRDQTCCGQLHLNSGYRDDAVRLAQRLGGVFAGYEAVVSPSSSCVGALRELVPELPVFELSEFLVQRLGLEDVGATLPLRMVAHSRNAAALAEFLESRDEVELVRYPGLASHPHHATAARFLTDGFGGMLSMRVRGGAAEMYAFTNALRIPAIAVSLGDLNSLV